MYEVELKAHLPDMQKTRTTVGTFAEYQGFLDKHDTYYRLKKKQGHITVRIRQEKETPPAEKAESPRNTTWVTYKKKELRLAKDKSGYEVNEEHEFSVSDAEDFALILKDAGFKKHMQKHKTAYSFIHGDFHIELCTIDRLGDFIEIETFSDTNGSARMKALHDKLVQELMLCGVSPELIENRFYSELLKEAE
ncbi:MAG: class IV adenylate cyclase [Treponemataceae bacterium]|nr:class IV adenylate cyclase [Treponemataceae bacterium]